MSLLDSFRDDLHALVPNLTEPPFDQMQSRLVLAYLSLRRAAELSYTKDEFRRRPPKERERIMQQLVQSGSLAHSRRGGVACDWEAGFYFNDALLRIAFLTEIGLKLLFLKHLGLAPPERDFPWLAEWYKDKFRQPFSKLQAAHTEVNRFKHGKVRADDASRSAERAFESMEDGTKAFGELLLLTKALNEPGSPNAPPQPTGSAGG